MSRYMNKEGIYVVHFEGDCCLSYSVKESEQTQLRIYDGPKQGAGSNLPEDYKTPDFPHTALLFDDVKSIEVVTEALMKLYNERSTEKVMEVNYSDKKVGW